MSARELVDRLMALWNDPPTGADAAARFAEIYTDPVTINGVETPLSGLVARAGVIGRALANRSSEILDVRGNDEHVTVAFRMKGTHVGPLPTAAGEVTGNDQPIEVPVIDLLLLEGGRIRKIWMVADMLAGLSSRVAIR